MFYRYILLNFAIICSANFNALNAQNFLFSKNKFNLKSGFVLSSGKYSPFLLRSNVYGLIPLVSQIGYISGDIQLEYDSLYTINKKLKPFGLGYGFSPHINYGKQNQILIPELYVKFRFKVLEIYVGRRKEIQGLVDTVATMGSYSWSGNALPLPKIQLSIPNYIPFLASGLISIKGHFAHGWLGSGDSVQNVLLHQKSLYLRIGKSIWNVKMYGGFNHQVQWGGKPNFPFFDNISQQKISNYGTDFNSFLKVATGVSLSKSGTAPNQQSGVPGNESTNRVGNHLGTIDLGLELEFSKIRLFLYKQSLFDDGSLFYLNNISDGLYGVSFKFKKNKPTLSGINFEVLNTTNQGGKLGPENGLGVPELRGLDNYFNNSIYWDGWTYKNSTLGSPYLLNDAPNVLPFKKINGWNIINNKVFVFSTSFYGKLQELGYLIRIAKGNNFGLLTNSKKYQQYYFSSELNKLKNNYKYSLKVLGDFGEVYQNNLGINCEITKYF